MKAEASAGKKKIETMLVKMDERHGYIRWLLEWDKKPRRPLPVFPDELRPSADALKAVWEGHEKVLAQYKRCGFAYVEADVLDDDDQYEEARILSHL